MEHQTKMLTLRARLQHTWDILKKFDLLAFMIVVSIAAFYLRYLNFDFISADFQYFLGPWHEQIKADGGLAGIGVMPEGCNYTPAYLFIMALATHLPVSGLVGVKLFSIIFDYVLAIFVGLIILHFTKKKTTALMAYTATLFFPAVFINSAIWAQCDGIYTAFLIMSLYFMLKEKGVPSMIAFGLAISFKLQAIFFIPIVIIAVLKKKIKIWTPILAVASFFATGLPAVIAGMAPSVAYGVYLLQAEYYSQLNLNAPNLYLWIVSPQTYQACETFADSFVWFAFGSIGCAMLPLYKSKYRTNNDMIWILATLFFAAFMPFVLPHMHERYWYFSDIMALILLFCRPKLWYVSASLALPSLYSLGIFIFQSSKTPLPYFAVLMLVGICLSGYYLWEEVRNSTLPEKTNEDLKEGALDNPAP